MNNLIHMRDQRFNPRPVSRPGWNGSGDVCGLSDLLQLMGADTDADPGYGAARMPVSLRLLHAGDTLFHEGARCEAIHFVRAGTFKSFRTAEDGYEQVLGFAGRAEVLGFDAFDSGFHPNGAVALEDSSVYFVLLGDFCGFGQHAPAFDRLVHRAVSAALARRGELADVMAAVAAEVRLARFLLQLSQRMAACGQSPRRFHLRMSRRDIASYLGVAHETVSRSFGALAGWRLVSVDNREVEILDMPGLKAFALNTRRHVDDDGRPSGAGLNIARAGVQQRAA